MKYSLIIIAVMFVIAITSLFFIVKNNDEVNKDCLGFYGYDERFECCELCISLNQSLIKRNNSDCVCYDGNMNITRIKIT